MICCQALQLISLFLKIYLICVHIVNRSLRDETISLLINFSIDRILFTSFFDN